MQRSSYKFIGVIRRISLNLDQNGLKNDSKEMRQQKKTSKGLVWVISYIVAQRKTDMNLW